MLAAYLVWHLRRAWAELTHTDQLHNDSTSVSVHSAYSDAAAPHVPVADPGDHLRALQGPDLEQLVWIATVAAGGPVPPAYRLADGNTNADPTHVPTWDGLAALLGRAGFRYVAAGG